jgi:hypothetical protein
MKNMKRIHSVTLKRMIDESPDTSWLGEYGQRAESEYSIDREHATDCPINTGKSAKSGLFIERDDDTECTCGGQYLDRNSYQFFNPNHENYKGIGHDETVKYCLQDYARMESLNNGNFCFIGIRAEAEYSLIESDRCGLLIQEVSSGGLWGIESDSEPAYLAEIEQEELSELKKQLRAIGFSSRAIATAFKNAERKES